MRNFWKIFGLFFTALGSASTAFVIIDWITSEKVPQPPNIAELVYGRIIMIAFSLFMTGGGFNIFRHSK